MFFKDLLGNQELIAQLIGQVERGEIPHAQLFCGQENDESFALAWAFARFVNCQKRTHDSCGACQHCRLFSNLTHPDFLLSFPIPQENKQNTSASLMSEFRALVLENPYISLEKWNETLNNQKKQALISVHESAFLLEQLQLTHFSAPYKIVLMWLPEKLNTAAANKLLKIIEEPSPSKLFLLVSHEPKVILPTILSRLQSHVLQKIPADILEKWLIQNHPQLNDPALLIQNAQGSRGKLLELLSENTPKQLPTFIQWMRICFKKDMFSILPFVDELAASGRENQKLLLEYALEMLHKILQWNYLEKKIANAEEMDFIIKFAPYVSAQILPDLQMLFEKALADIVRNAHPKILFLDLSFGLFKLFKYEK